MATTRKELLEFCTIAANGCILWHGGKDRKGYGRVSFFGKMNGAHRVSYILENGAIPDGMMVCHSCDNPSCINPKHLWLGTAKQNNDDAIKKGRRRYLYGEEQHKSKLTEAQVRFIRKTKIPTTVLAKKYGVSQCSVSHARIGRTWKNLKEF